MTDARLLVVEDEPTIRELLAGSLRYAGFDVTAVGRGGLAVTAALRRPPDLVVLDVMLPDMDGFEVLSRIRSGGSRVPALFLTARDSVEDRIRGLTIGGDDYVVKPFNLDEVVARIRAVLRRVQAGPAGAPDRLRVADIELDEDAQEVRRAGHLIELSPTEFRLLRFFLTNTGRVLSKAQILDHVWQYDFRGDAGIVEKYVAALRRKVDNGDPPLIHTRRGVGYVLRVPD